MSFIEIPLVEETFNCNIYVLDLETPNMLGCKINLWNTLLYKSAARDNANKYWLLFGENHYHTINNINSFLAVRRFCTKCFNTFLHIDAYNKHNCTAEDEPKKKRVKSSRTNKDLSHYLKSDFCKGSKEELKAKLEDMEDMEK